MRKKTLAWGGAILALTLDGGLHSRCFAEETKLTIPSASQEVKKADVGHIDATVLKILIDSKIPMTILDGRGEKWDDGRRIPGAQLTHYEKDINEIGKLIPGKDKLVVVYCGSAQCPVGGRLAEKLVVNGYQYVLEYKGGIKEWADSLKYPVENTKDKK